MKLGFGLYRHMLNDRFYRFARQCGATHIVAHLTDYFHKTDTPVDDQPVGSLRGWGHAPREPLWSADMLRGLVADMAGHGLTLEALENINPAFWHDVLLDGPRRAEQVEQVRQLVRNMSAAGIPILGYNFSLAAVAGRVQGAFARGQAVAVGLEGPSRELEEPLPLGMVWNMVYDADAPEGTLPTITREQLWSRYEAFLADVLPTAEREGVTLAIHPDDPPLPEVRKQPRLTYQPEHLQRVLDLRQSPCHRLELCLGTVTEMTEGDVHTWVDRFSKADRIGYIHLRNVRGKAPFYKETFIDEGDMDVPRIVRTLKQNNFRGVVIPDHAPQMDCDAPWHAGMAFAMGYIKALIDAPTPD